MEEALEQIKFNLSDVYDDDERILQALFRGVSHTGFMGKYLNGYPDTAAPNYVPPGWDDWNSPAAGNPYSEFNYTLNENGNLVNYAFIQRTRRFRQTSLDPI